MQMVCNWNTGVPYQAAYDGLAALANYREFFSSLERDLWRAKAAGVN